jgi:outer membrane protein assembly factor BamB
MDFQQQSGKSTLDFNARDRLQGKERVLCFDGRTGKSLWTHAYDCEYHISYATGPRCTPTVSDGKVYALGAEGDLWCLDAASGKVVWSHDLNRDYQAETPLWGFCGHPLVEGNKLICLVGGPGSTAVAFDKKTGRELWRSLTARESGYCAPSVLEAGGRRQLIIWHAESLNGLDPETGKPYWSVPLVPNYGMSIAAPRKLGDLLFASGIGNVALVVRLAAEQPEVSEVWRGGAKDAVHSGNCTPFLEDGMIYGCDCQTGHLRGVKLETGDRIWETMAPTAGGDRRASHGTAFIVKNGDRFFLFSETGRLIIARLMPEKYEELSSAQLLEPTGTAFGRQVVWSHPAFANRCIFARNDRELVCASLAAP